MPVQNYRKLPAPVQAIQFDGKNVDDVRQLIGQPKAMYNDKQQQLFINTGTSESPVHQGWWVVKGDAGIQILSPEVFAQDYEAAPTPSETHTQAKAAS